MAVDRVAVQGGLLDGSRLVVRDDLVTEEVEVDPLFRASSFGQAQYRAIKVACCDQVIYGKGDVEGTKL